MLVEVRKAAAGTEYWDTKKKKTVFVKRGDKPSFEVTKNPKSMLTPEDPKGVKDIPNDPTDLNELDAEQLKAYAAENGIEVPGNMKKEETIRKHIEESLAEVDE